MWARVALVAVFVACSGDDDADAGRPTRDGGARDGTTDTAATDVVAERVGEDPREHDAAGRLDADDVGDSRPDDPDAPGLLDAMDGALPDADGSDAGGPDAPMSSDAPAGDGGPCESVIETFTPDPSPHIPNCSPVTYSTNPPTSGPHYPVWAAFRRYVTPVPRGYTVHSMEHGAVVISYNCPTNCDADLAALESFLAGRPADPMCVSPIRHRIVITPDPLLDVPFAAAAWGASLKSRCLDLPALGAFLDAHYGRAPEDFCFDGVDPTAVDAGGPCPAPLDAGPPSPT